MDGRKEPEVKKEDKKQVSDTALPVLACKAATSDPEYWLTEEKCGTREKPLSSIKKYAQFFLSKDQIEAAAKHPNVKNMKTVSVRERWINKLFHQYVKTHGYKQIIILGAGYDIRPLKKSLHERRVKEKPNPLYAGVKFWEIDRAEILDNKKKCLEEHNLNENATYIKADYTNPDFIRQLLESGLNPQEPIFVIFEGNLMYLENEKQAENVFNLLKFTFKNFVIAFDYFPQSVVDMISARAKSNPASNESLWKTGINNLQDFASKCGLTVIDNQSIGKLSKDLGVDANPSPGANSYSVCALRK